jgi:hypothetical protein
VRSGADGALALKELSVSSPPELCRPEVPLILLTWAFCLRRTGLPLSTYFSAIKLRWMIDNWEDVHKAHETDDLAFGTIESWIAYVSLLQLHFLSLGPHS